MKIANNHYHKITRRQISQFSLKHFRMIWMILKFIKWHLILKMLWVGLAHDRVSYFIAVHWLSSFLAATLNFSIVELQRFEPGAAGWEALNATSVLPPFLERVTLLPKYGESLTHPDSHISFSTVVLFGIISRFPEKVYNIEHTLVRWNWKHLVLNF